MESQFFVCRSMVLHNVSTWVHCTEKGMVVLPGYQFFDDIHGLLALLDVHIKLDVMKEKIVHVSAAAVDAFVTHTIFRFILRDPAWPSVWLESILFSQHQELFSDSRDVLLQFNQPRQILFIPRVRLISV